MTDEPLFSRSSALREAESMLAVIQRVTRASVTVKDTVTGKIAVGLVVLLGVEEGDTEQDAEYLARKTTELRIFEDDGGKMNRSVMDVHGSLLVVSQFTLLADTRKGRRPSYHLAADPRTGELLYGRFVQLAELTGCHVETGVFGAMMTVEILNDGPVTLIIDSRKR